MNKKILALPLLSLLCLTSCGETSTRYGLYSFTMGRSGAGETRVGLSIDLTNVKEEEGGKVLGERFNIKLETDQLDEPYSLDGYYNYDENTKRVKLNAKIKFQSNDGSYVIPGELLQYIAVTYLEKDTFTLKMPVSMPINPFDLGDIDVSRFFDNDLLHQLVWYGFFFDLDTLNLYWDLRKVNYDSKSPGYARALPGDITDDEKGVKFDETIEKKLKKHPESTDENNEISALNYQCRDIFSRARFYKKETVEGIEIDKLIGSVTQEYMTGANGEQKEIYVFNALGGFQFTGYEIKDCYIKDDLLGLFKTKVDIILGQQGNIIDKIYQAGSTTVEETTAEQYYKTYKPFVFRDYHQISIGLKKD